MTTKLIGLLLLAGGAAFAESRFSISIGTGNYGHGSGYYYAPSQSSSYGYDRGSSYGYDRGGAGYGGNNRRHEREERRGLHRHQEAEQYTYGDSRALREHQAQERHELQHE